MSKPVLFVSGIGTSLSRSENLSALYEAYNGDKRFFHFYDTAYRNAVASGKYDVTVVDTFPILSTGTTIMIWHAIQGGKYTGLDEGTRYYNDHTKELIDYIIASGTGGVGLWHRSTHIPKDRILPLGAPRTDHYIGKKKGDGGTIFANKRTFLYAPTFRTEAEPRLPDIDWEYISSQLADNERLVVKAHPFTKSMHVRNIPRIMEVSASEPTERYLIDSDVVITDYSSIMFDAYLLGKPVILFEKNTGYTNSRGMYLRYPDQYSSRYVTNEQDLVRMLHSDLTLTETERACIRNVADMCDGHSCERICSLINKLNGE